MSPRSAAGIAIHLGLLIWFSACAAGPVDPTDTSYDLEAASAEAACTEADVQACSCAAGPSVRSCVDGQWEDCDCGGSTIATPVPAPPIPMALPEADMPEFCKAGYYTGDFSGEYWSGAFDIGFGSLVPVTIHAKPVGARPGLGFTLRDTPREDGNTEVYTVEDGCLLGTAEASGTEHPIFGKITGEVDCQTGKVTGVLEGYYYLFGVPQVVYPFKGPVTAMYLPDQQRMSDGKWDVKEHMQNANPPGGNGVWETHWTDEVEAAPGLPPECTALLEGNAPAEADVIL